MVFRLVVTHAWRMLEWMLVMIPPSPYEVKKLEAAGVTNPTLQSYAVWRRTMLMVALPSLGYSGFVNLGSLGADMESYVGHLNWLGKVATFLPIFSNLFLMLGSAGALWFWSNQVLSNRWVTTGWIISLVLPFLPAFIPIEYLVGPELSAIFKENPETHQLNNNVMAILYMAKLLPTFVSIPLGMVRASLRIRGLLPDNALAGWILMVTLPLKLITFVLGLVLASQMMGHLLLIAAITCYIIGPLVYMWNRKLYTDNATDDWTTQVQHRQGLVRWSGLAGLILLSVWLFTSEFYGTKLVGWADADPAPLLTYQDVVRAVFEFMGRTFMATLCFADLCLRAAIANWTTEVQQREGNATQERDEKYAGLKRELHGDGQATSNASKAPKTMDEEDPGTESLKTAMPSEDGVKETSPPETSLQSKESDEMVTI